MLIRFDRLAATSLATLALTQRAAGATSCSWDYDSFTSPANNTYAVGECGLSSKLDHMRRAFVSHCNATTVGFHDAAFWHELDHWYPIYLFRKDDDVNDTQFVDCLKTWHASDAPRGMGISTAAVMLGVCVFAYALR